MPTAPSVPDATFLLHGTTVDGKDDIAARALIFATDHMEATIATECCKIEPEKFKLLRAQGKAFGTDEALEMGLLTGIVEQEEEPVYQAQMCSGNVWQFPMDRAVIAALARHITGHNSATLFVGLPSAYLTASRQLAER